MTPNDLIDDLRGRINPAYARQLGTESYERRLCVEALEAQAAVIEKMRNALIDIQSIRVICGSTGDFKDGQLVALEACGKVANDALEANTAQPKEMSSEYMA